MTHRSPTLSCRRAALVEQMVVALARKAAPFDQEISDLISAYEDNVDHEEWLNSADFTEVPKHIMDIVNGPQMGQPVPEEPKWFQRLFARLR